MDFITAINDVLARLREEPVSTPTQDTYSTLISKYVNDAKREVEDKWDWNVLKTEVSITTSANTYSYSLTGAGDRFRVLSVWNDTQEVFMRRIEHWKIKQGLKTSSANTGVPVRYTFEGEDSNNDPKVLIWPIPNGVYNIDFHLIVPQAELTSGSTEISVPWYPVVLRAYAKAISERGEDGGTSYNEAMLDYQEALADAIKNDVSRTPEETIWYVE